MSVSIIELFQLSDLVDDARNFIKFAHRGQMYGDMEYWHHPVQVADTVEDATVEEYVAALLHDVVEDTAWGNDIDGLRKRFGDEVMDMVLLLSKDTNLTYRGNIQRIIDSGNVGAMKVKLADNRVNIAGDKSHMDPDRRDRLQARYAMSINMLEEALSTQ